MNCPHCQAPDPKRNGKRNGKQRYRCGVCGKTFVEQPTKPQGRPLISDRPLTPAEHMRRHRAKKKGIL